MPPLKAYSELKKIFRRIKLLGESLSVLQWDWAAMMPEGGGIRRAEQMAEIEVLIHEIMTDKGLEPLFEGLEGARLNSWQKANAKCMKDSWLRANCLPAQLVSELSRSSSHCEMIWRKTRETGEIHLFIEAFEPLITIVREKSLILGEAMSCDPYDALIDQYDPGAKQTEIDALFNELQSFLPGFLKLVQEKQRHCGNKIKDIPLDIKSQVVLAENTMRSLGFDFLHGRLDTSHHPFCGGVSQDVRITTRYDPHDVLTGLMGVIHETGHALYERGLPESWKDQPLGEACGMSLHESQSLIFEMQACRSEGFFEYLAPCLNAFNEFSQDQKPFTARELYTKATNVQPGLIRVNADEITYPFHIFLRYDLEKRLISGSLRAMDLPEAWNNGMKNFLGLEPQKPSDGFMQDIHWPTGSFGYFPSYTIGSILAAQLYESAIREFPDIDKQISMGDFTLLVSWLNKNVHSYGSRYNRSDLVKVATGQPLRTDAFIKHLKRRYLD